MEKLFKTIFIKYCLPSSFSFFLSFYFSKFSEINEGKLGITLDNEQNLQKLKNILIDKYDTFVCLQHKLNPEEKFLNLDREHLKFYSKHLSKTFQVNHFNDHNIIFEDSGHRNKDNLSHDNEIREIKNQYKFNPTENVKKKEKKFYYNSHITIDKNKFLILIISKELDSKVSKDSEYEIFLRDVLTGKVIKLISSYKLVNVIMI